MNDMRKLIKVLGFSLLAVFMLAACGKDTENTSKNEDGKLKVVTSFTIIADMAREIGGEIGRAHV